MSIRDDVSFIVSAPPVVRRPIVRGLRSAGARLGAQCFAARGAARSRARGKPAKRQNTRAAAHSARAAAALGARGGTAKPPPVGSSRASSSAAAAAVSDAMAETDASGGDVVVDPRGAVPRGAHAPPPPSPRARRARVRGGAHAGGVRGPRRPPRGDGSAGRAATPGRSRCAPPSSPCARRTPRPSPRSCDAWSSAASPSARSSSGRSSSRAAPGAWSRRPCALMARRERRRRKTPVPVVRR